MWDITRPSTMVNATNASSVIAAIGRYDSSFVTSYIRFWQLFDSGSLSIPTPPPPPKAIRTTTKKLLIFGLRRQPTKMQTFAVLVKRPM